MSYIYEEGEDLYKSNLPSGKKSPLYCKWRDMKRRCYNINDIAYHRYGGRGIKICNEWKNNFYNFVDWALKNKIKKDLTIDRINNDGNYCPENCRFVTLAENLRNREATEKLKETSSQLGKKYGGLNDWNKKRQRKIYCITNGKTYSSIAEASRILNLNPKHISSICNEKRKSTKGYRFVFVNKGYKNEKLCEVNKKQCIEELL